jgi:hypothetical protein
MRSAPAIATLLAMACAGQAAATPLPFKNLSAGGHLRHGVYGRIEVRGAEPPPLISKQPVLARQDLDTLRAQPIYLYVPPGQVRKWAQHCHKWQACDVPVLFVRMDNSPGRLGEWKQREGFSPVRLAGPVSRSSPP